MSFAPPTSNAIFIRNILVDDSAIANGKALVYNSATNKLEYQTASQSTFPSITVGPNGTIFFTGANAYSIVDDVDLGLLIYKGNALRIAFDSSGSIDFFGSVVYMNDGSGSGGGQLNMEGASILSALNITATGVISGSSVTGSSGSFSSLSSSSYTGITQAMVSGLTSALALLAPLASPTFTGTVTTAAIKVSGLRLNFRYVTGANTTALLTDDWIVVNTSALARTITLPAANTAGWGGKQIWVMKSSTSGSDTVNVSSTSTIVALTGSPTSSFGTQWTGALYTADATNNVWILRAG